MMKPDRFAQMMAEAVSVSLSHSDQRPFIPDGGALLWRWFIDLSLARRSGPVMAEPITYAEIEAYARLHRIPIQPSHVEVVMAMDRAYLDHAHAQVVASTSGGASQPTGKRPTLDAASFDAVFG